MTKRKNEGVNIHQSYTLFSLFSVLNSTLYTIMHEVQSKTPYGDEYSECYKYFTKEVIKTTKKFSRLVRKCQDKQEGKL